MLALRNLLRFLTLIAFAALALPALADNKSFSVVAPASIAVGTSVIDVTFTNNASGNSTFNSMEIDIAAGSLTISDAVLKGTTVHANPLTSTSAVFGNLSPVKRGQSIVISLTVTATASDCAASQVSWNAKAWTGSPTSPSSVFTLSPAISPSTINPGCTLGFVKQPASAQAGQVITSVPSDPTGAPVSVGRFLGNGSPDPSFAGPVSIAIKAGTGTAGATLTGSVASFSGGVASFPALSIDKIGSGYVLTATAGALAVNSSAFSMFGGVLGCTDGSNYDSSTGTTDFTLDPNLDSAYVGTPGWGLRRGPNWDSGNCVKVDYTFNLDAPNNIASLLWDKTTGQHAAFKYVVLWNPVAVKGPTDPIAGWTSVRPELSWGVANPVVGTGDYVPALMCVSDDLTQGLALLPTIPNVAPFNDTTKYPPAVYPQYQPGQVAKMCVAQQGQTSVGVDGSGNVLVQYWDKVIDEADGFIHLNP